MSGNPPIQGNYFAGSTSYIPPPPKPIANPAFGAPKASGWDAPKPGIKAPHATLHPPLPNSSSAGHPFKSQAIGSPYDFNTFPANTAPAVEANTSAGAESGEGPAANFPSSHGYLTAPFPLQAERATYHQTSLHSPPRRSGPEGVGTRSEADSQTNAFASALAARQSARIGESAGGSPASLSVRSSNPLTVQRTTATYPIVSSLETKEQGIQGRPSRASGASLPHEMPIPCGGLHPCLEAPDTAAPTEAAPHQCPPRASPLQAPTITGAPTCNFLDETGHFSGSAFSRKSSFNSQQLSTFRSQIPNGEGPPSSSGRPPRGGGAHPGKLGGFSRGRSRGEELLAAALERRRASALGATFMKTSGKGAQDLLSTKSSLSRATGPNSRRLESTLHEGEGSWGPLPDSHHKATQPSDSRQRDNRDRYPAGSAVPYASNVVTSMQGNAYNSPKGLSEQPIQNAFNVQKGGDAPQEMENADELFFSNSTLDNNNNNNRAEGAEEPPNSVEYHFPKPSMVNGPSYREGAYEENIHLKGSDSRRTRAPASMKTNPPPIPFGSNANGSTSDEIHDPVNDSAVESSNLFASMRSAKATPKLSILKGEDHNIILREGYAIDNPPVLRQETGKLPQSPSEDPLPRPTILSGGNQAPVQPDKQSLSLLPFPHPQQQGRRLELETPRDLPNGHTLPDSFFHLQRVAAGEKPSYRRMISTSEKNARIYEESPAPRYPEVKTESEATIQLSGTPAELNAKSSNAINSAATTPEVQKRGGSVEYFEHGDGAQGLMEDFNNSAVSVETRWAKAGADPNGEPKSTSFDTKGLVIASSPDGCEGGKTISEPTHLFLNGEVECEPNAAVDVAKGSPQNVPEQMTMPKESNLPKPSVNTSSSASAIQVTHPDKMAASTGACTLTPTLKSKDGSFTLTSILNDQSLAMQKEKQEEQEPDALVNPFASSVSYRTPNSSNSVYQRSSLQVEPSRTYAPCFALFHPGHGGIIALFNQPEEPAKSKGALGAVKQPPVKSFVRDMTDRTSSSDTNEKKNTRRSHLVFCSLSEAMSRFDPLGKEKVIKGTEAGRRYIASMEALARSPFFASNGVTPLSDFTIEKAQELLGILQKGENAPLTQVLEIMLADALAPNEHAFLWSRGGDKKLVHLLMQEASAISSSSGFRDMDSGGTGRMRLLPTQKTPCTMTNPQDGLARVQLLLCEGNREAAVEVALEHRLFLHAVLIAMMCPTREHYMKSIKEVVYKELQPHSPLSHAYCLFNELPLPPLVPYPTSHTRESDSNPFAGNAKGEQLGNPSQQHSKESLLQCLLSNSEEPLPSAAAAKQENWEYLKSSWPQQAAMLIANYTRSSGDGLLQLGDTLQQSGLVLEAHTCFLLGHLCPLGTAKGGKHTSPERDSFRNQLRCRLGVLGGLYAPNITGRAAFLTPTSTLLTDLLQEVRCHLDLRLPPPLPEGGSPDEGEAENHIVSVSPREDVQPHSPLPCHGLPMRPFRYAVAFHFMQVLWLQEVGMLAEANRALHDLLKVIPPPKFALSGPPRTLNEFVYFFAQLPFPEQTAPQSGTCADTSHQPDGQSDYQNVEIKRMGAPSQPSSGEHPPQPTLCSEPNITPSQVPPSRKQEGPAAPLSYPPPPPLPLNASSNRPPQPPRIGNPVPKAGMPAPVEGAQRPQPLVPAPFATAPAPLRAEAPSTQPPPSPPPPLERAKSPPTAALGTPECPPSPSKTRGYSTTTPTTASDGDGRPKREGGGSKGGKHQRSGSIETFLGFFRRDKGGDLSEAKKAEVAKPMILDTKPVPQFDQATGRWMFPQSEEDKAREALAKAGPPKMPPGGVGSKGPGGEPPFLQKRRGPGNKPQYVDMFNT